jgi:hypothetical protein
MALPERLTAMLGGPGRFRFIIQPLVALLLGIRDGRRDAKDGRPAYLISVFFVREGRRKALEDGIRAFGKPFVIAVVMDSVVQFYLFHNVRLGSALVVGTLLIALPYSIARGVTNRIVRWSGRRRGKH